MRANETATATIRGARPRTTRRRRRGVSYPDSDGKPMGESELHRDEMWRLIYLLQAFFAAFVDIHVSGNLILYYEEGNPRASISPDVFVVKGVPKARRLIYKLWEEGVAPCFVIEVTSSSTRRVDEGKKRDLYARLGVQEYILYDPRFPGLETRYPPLRGYRLIPSGYEPMELGPDGSVLSEELGLQLALEDGLLQFHDQRTGARLLSLTERAELEAERAELEAARAELEAARAELEAARARAAELRADAEAEAGRLEAEARQAAEARVAELEALLREQRANGDL